MIQNHLYRKMQSSGEKPFKGKFVTKSLVVTDVEHNRIVYYVFSLLAQNIDCLHGRERFNIKHRSLSIRAPTLAIFCGCVKAKHPRGYFLSILLNQRVFRQERLSVEKYYQVSLRIVRRSCQIKRGHEGSVFC